MRIMFFSKMNDNQYGISITNQFAPTTLGGSVKTIITKERDLDNKLEENFVSINEEQRDRMKNTTQGFIVLAD